MSSGSLMPSRCRGLFSGSSSQTHRTMVPRLCFSSAPPMPYPSNPVRPAEGPVRPGPGWPAGAGPRTARPGPPEQRLVRPAGPFRGEPAVLVEAAHRPCLGADHRPLLVDPGVHQGGALVEREDDVGAELVLDPHRDLRGEPVHRAVEVRLEGDPVVVDDGQPVLTGRDDVVRLHPVDVHREHLLEPGAERQHLEPARVGERRAGPVHEPAEAAALLDDVRSGLQVQVIGVGQHRLRLEVGHRLRQHRLHRRLGADGDERRGVG